MQLSKTTVTSTRFINIAYIPSFVRRKRQCCTQWSLLWRDFLHACPYLILLIVLLPEIAVGGEMLGFGKKEKVYPFSGFSGQILYKGEPAVFAKITRKYELLKEHYEETTISDEKGQFSFDSIQLE